VGSTAQASSVNCGIICSGVHYGNIKVKVAICDETLDICTKLGDEVKFVKSGAVEMLVNEVHYQAAQKKVSDLYKMGYTRDDVQFLDKTQLMQLEPQAGSNILGAIWFPKTGHVNPRKMVKAIGKRAT
jgi:L-2-hydroxyglutarate oxidase LhgO